MPYFWSSVTSVISPKSRMQSCPSGVRIMLPGWGSAWKKPSPRSCVQHVVGRGLRQLLAVDPLRHVHAPGGVLGIVLRNLHLGQVLHVLRDAQSVLALEVVVELVVEPPGELVHQPHQIGAILQEGQAPQGQAKLPHEMQVEAHRLQDERPLHLNGHLQPVGPQLSLVDLPQARRGNWLGRQLTEDLLGVAPQLVADRLHGDARIKARHLVAQLLELHHGLGRQDVWPDAQGLADLDEEGSQRRHQLPKFRRPLHLHLRTFPSHRRVERQLEQEAGRRRQDLKAALHHRLRASTEEALELRGVVAQRQLAAPLHLHEA
eukprot:scaffold831_cov268-Pinguiococcus_pyrenoidosus.AAC.22